MVILLSEMSLGDADMVRGMHGIKCLQLAWESPLGKYIHKSKGTKIH